jgi:hypothetical protein
MTKYEESDWEELPEAVREAAKVLGYDESIWDNDGKTPFDDKEW